MIIQIHCVSHNQQRYPTCGDWFWENDKTKLTLVISKHGDKRSGFAIAIHELVEALACEVNGVSQQAVDVWDTTNLDAEEPGADPEAPYHHEHMAAEMAERAFLAVTGLSWAEHEANVNALFKETTNGG